VGHRLERLATAVERELRRVGPQAGLIQLAARWSDLVGEQIARNAWPARLGRDGALHVATSSSAWAFELTAMSGLVLERVAGVLEDGLPRRLVFAPGTLPEPVSDPATRPDPAKVEPGPAERRLALELTASASDPDLRSRIARAAAASLARPA